MSNTPGIPPSAILQLVQDAPLEVDGDYEFDQFDRLYIDSQSRGLQGLVLQCLLLGTHCTWMTLDPSSAAAATGNVVCSASTLNLTQTLATAAALAVAGGPTGVVVLGAAPGAKILVALKGVVPAAIVNLPGNSGTLAKVNTTNATVTETTSLASGDYPLGTVDAQGNLTLSILATGPYTVAASTLFSPVTFMEKVSAQTPSNDTFTCASGNYSVGCTFLLYTGQTGIQCTGVRTYWQGVAGGAKTLKGSLWQYGTSGVGTSTRITSATLAVPATNGEVIISFASGETLTPGVFYGVSIWETSGAYYPSIGVAGNADSIMETVLNTSTLIASPYLLYATVNGNGGGTQCPFLLYHSGDAAPLNISTGSYFPVEPVISV